jgi:hypothetical protein
MLGTDLGAAGWPNSGEIDVMENVGFEPNTVHGTIHGPGYSGSGGIGASYGGSTFSEGFHAYSADWSPNQIKWYVDGNLYQTRTPGDLDDNRWVFDHKFFLVLNLAVGGDWPGNPDSSTQFPQQLVVDYVHVTDGSGARAGSLIGFGGKCLDVDGSKTANGTTVQLYDCNGTAAQKWNVGADGAFRALSRYLDVKGSGTADGTPVQLFDCNGTVAQKWVVAASGDIVNPHAGKCLTRLAGGRQTVLGFKFGAAQAAPTKSGIFADPPSPWVRNS